MRDDDPGDRADREWSDDQRARIAELIDDYRERIGGCLAGLTEQEARRRLVPSKTTLLGLVKHLTFVEGVWFDQAVTGRSAKGVGIAGTVDGSFTLSPADTIESVGAAYRARCRRSREVMAGRRPDEVVDGRGARPVWALELQVLRELAHHCGHADILREQILAAREA